MNHRLFLAALLVTAGSAVAADPPPELGKNVQRTMRLLATSTPEHRNTVRILFYGQSITEQRWAAEVAEGAHASALRNARKARVLPSASER